MTDNIKVEIDKNDTNEAKLLGISALLGKDVSAFKESVIFF